MKAPGLNIKELAQQVAERLEELGLVSDEPGRLDAGSRPDGEGG